MHASGKVQAVAFSRNGTLVSAGTNGPIQVWDDWTGELRGTLPGHPDLVRSLVFSSDNTTLASATKDDVKVWHIYKKELIHTFNHTDWGNSWQKIAISPDGKTLAIVGLDRITLFDIQSGENKAVFEQRVRFVAYSPDGKTLACGGKDLPNQIFLLDAQTGALKGKIEQEGDDNTSFRVIAFSPDGKTLVSADRRVGNEKELKVWDIATGTLKRTLPATFKYYDDMDSISFSPDGKHVAAASEVYIYVWDVETGEVKKTIKDTHSVEDVAFSPDGKTLASGNSYQFVKLWDVSGL
jgi:WD40 repeat protein